MIIMILNLTTTRVKPRLSPERAKMRTATQHHGTPGVPARRRPAVAVLGRGDASVAVPHPPTGGLVRADQRQLERWENEGGALGSPRAASRAVPGGAPG